MLRILTALAIAVPAVSVPVGPERVAVEPAAVETGALWTLTWDDSCDAVLDSTEKSCWVALTVVGDHVGGSFAGPVLGRTREAIFGGEILRGGLVTLVQREADYACSYQMTPAGDGCWHGTWRDTNGAAGTVVLTRDLPEGTPPPTDTTTTLRITH
ncbi:MAG: hypothetical protein KDE27_18775 [Planctomycetes bacterium]|nr:hypothetical protein [Planctomycetota bacterium]